MPAPHSIERRELVIALVKAGHTTDEVCELTKVGEASVRRWKRRLRETGGLEPAPSSPGRPRKYREELIETLLSLVEQEPDATLEEMAAVLQTLFDIDIDFRAVSRILVDHGYTSKKKTFRLSETDANELERQREEFLDEVADVPPEKLVFLDEAGSNLAMTPQRARARVGERAFAPRPTRRGKKRDDDRHVGLLGDGAMRGSRRRGE